MSKKKKAEKHYITYADTQRLILSVGESIKLTNESGVELCVTLFPSVHHE